MGLYRFGGHNESKRFFKDVFEPIVTSETQKEYLDNVWIGTKGPIHRGPFPFPMGEIEASSKWTPGIRVNGLNEAVEIFYGLKGFNIIVPQNHIIDYSKVGYYACSGENRKETILNYISFNEGFGGDEWRSFKNASAESKARNIKFFERAFYEVSGGIKTGFIYLDFFFNLPVKEKCIFTNKYGEQQEEYIDRFLSIGVYSGIRNSELVYRHSKKMNANGIQFELILYDDARIPAYQDYPVVEDVALWSAIDRMDFFP